MGAWADIIKVLRSTVFKNELKNGDYSVKHATKADKLGNLGNTTDNVARHVWFSDSETSGLPRKDDDFKYNPSTNTLTVETVKIKDLTLSEPAEFTDKKLPNKGYYLISAKYLIPDELRWVLINSGLLYWDGETYMDVKVNDEYEVAVNYDGEFAISKGGTDLTSYCTNIKIKQISIT